MRLTFLRIQGFRCFAEAQEIRFPASGIIPIVGTRPDGGSSGSGKTSVLQAIALGLGFSSFASTRQQSWLTKLPMQIVVGLETEDGIDSLEVHRGKKTAVILNGEEVAGGATEVNKWLTTYFGLDPKLLQTLSFRPQRKGGLFMGLGPSEKRIFLASILNFMRFENLAKAIGDEISGIQKQVAIQESAINLVSQPALPAAERVTSFAHNDGIVNGDFQPDGWDDVKNLYEEARLAAEATLAELNQRLQNHSKQQAAFGARIAEDEAAVQRFAKEEAATVVMVDSEEAPALRLALEQVGERLHMLGGKAKELDVRRQELRAEVAASTQGIVAAERALTAKQAISDTRSTLIEALYAQKCNTCGQSWSDEIKLREAERLYTEDVLMVSGAAAHLAAVQQRKTQGEAELAEIETKSQKIAGGLDKYRAESASLTQRLTEAKFKSQREAQSKIDAIRAKYEKELEVVRRNSNEGRDLHYQKVSDLSTAVERARSEVYRIEGKSDVMRQKMASLKRQNEGVDQLWANYESARLKIAKCTREAEELRNSLQEKMDLQAATRAFLGAISEEVLAEIREEANRMLMALPNVKGVGIRFTTETQQGTGTLKQEIRTVLTYGQEDDIEPESQLSGGQLTSVELAVDRAVSKVLRRRRGGFRLPSWMALDESFDGHDLLTKEACLDFLRTETGDSQILVIDHASEFREAFDHAIVVTAGEKVQVGDHLLPSTGSTLTIT